MNTIFNFLATATWWQIALVWIGLLICIGFFAGLLRSNPGIETHERELQPQPVGKLRWAFRLAFLGFFMAWFALGKKGGESASRR